MLDTAGGLKGWMERVENLPGVGSYFSLAFSRNWVYHGSSRQCSIKPLNIEAGVCDRTEDFFLRVGELSFAFLVHFFWVEDFTSDTCGVFRLSEHMNLVGIFDTGKSQEEE